MTLNRWQFSLRALLIVMAVVAAITAFAANYPTAALLIVFGTAWLLFESGAIFEIIQNLNKPEVFARHPILATAVCSNVGILFLTLSGIFGWRLTEYKDAWRFLLLLMSTTLFAGLAIWCFRLLRKSFQRPIDVEASPRSDHLPH